MAVQMIKAGLNDTLDSNVHYYLDELALLFKTSIDVIKKQKHELLQELESSKEVAMVSFENEDNFYITFWTNYCN